LAGSGAKVLRLGGLFNWGTGDGPVRGQLLRLKCLIGLGTYGVLGEEGWARSIELCPRVGEHVSHERLYAGPWICLLNCVGGLRPTAALADDFTLPSS